ncbi:Asp-tRNA(Asn)/Glu-tRNA(Gln) amidotransferase subunit GatC [Proteinivorax hydrogeniformans]|uniref:Asp-tRNA(Asn)/Glu-tRNA(Gln) amidotransferase subunit GatC n=1 Tax=Proteinivorax hydrogeniformans TaxID=1826727 RepID=A0AAU8HS16_9FIRM
MKITAKQLNEIASLSMLNIKQEEIDEYIKELDQVLTYADNLKKLDLDDVKPAKHCLFEERITREDKVVQLRSKKSLHNDINLKDTFIED